MSTAPTQRDPRTDPLLAAVPEEAGYKVLDQRYVLYDTIGHGGMGVVFKGRHAELEVDLAVKCLDPSLARRDQGLVTRFKKEARAAAHLRHENVVQVMDVSECAGVHYLVMEFIAGEDARRRVARKRQLDVGEAARIAMGAARGLAAAHATGLVHRDVKPDNVMIGSDGSVKVADLGLAKSEGSDTGLTMSGATMGTPLYMPPEQFGDTKNVGPPADVYALGATLYFLLVGKDGIKPGSIAQVLDQVRTKPFPDPREARPDVPDTLAELVLHCTRKEPSERPQRVEEVAAVLAEYLDGPGPELADPQAGTVMVETLVSPPPPKTLATIRMTFAGTQTPPASQPAGETAPTRPVTEVKPKPVALWVGIGAVLAVLAVLMILEPWASEEPETEPSERVAAQPPASSTSGAERQSPVGPRSETESTPAVTPRTTPAQQLSPQHDQIAGESESGPSTAEIEMPEGSASVTEPASKKFDAADLAATTPPDTASVPSSVGTSASIAANRSRAPEGLTVVQSTPGVGESAQAAGPGAAAGWAWRVRHDPSGVEFLLVEPGTFTMGSPPSEPGRDGDEQPRVTAIANPFYLARTELTQAQWAAVQGEEHASHHEGGDRPVERVTWTEANDFVRSLGWQLPPAAHWEFACRAGSTGRFASGSTPEDLARLAWFDEDHSIAATHAVATRQPNAWGFHDMHGNVFEWCENLFRAKQAGPNSGAHDRREYRGGGYRSQWRLCRSANRGGLRPGDESRDLGFRPAILLDAESR